MVKPQILRFESLPSTNQEVINRALAGAPEGLCIVAAEQTAGRGRMQRDWISPKNAGLYVSVLLRPTFAPETWPLLTLMTAVAVNDALRETCDLQTDIKWPNDILVNDKKLCGILAETFETSSGRAVVIGIGVNLSKESFPGELQQTATSVEEVTGRTANVDQLLQVVITRLISCYEILGTAQGPEEILAEWIKRSSYAEGKPIQVRETDKMFSGTTRGLERDGGLRVETSAGEIRIVRAGDVTSVRSGNHP
jgi:BirA family biotin operon repressor/biotin-[acetyl-CoA-carboxylase] ligase